MDNTHLVYKHTKPTRLTWLKYIGKNLQNNNNTNHSSYINNNSNDNDVNII